MDELVTLRIWGNDDVGPWEEKHRCKILDILATLEEYDYDFVGFECLKDTAEEPMPLLIF